MNCHVALIINVVHLNNERYESNIHDISDNTLQLYRLDVAYYKIEIELLNLTNGVYW